MPRPLTKSPPINFRLDLDSWTQLQAMAASKNLTPAQLAQAIVTKAVIEHDQVEQAKARMGAAAASRQRGRRGITRTPYVDAP